MPTGIYKRSKAQIKKAREYHPRGVNHPFWKGDKVSKGALHKWLGRNYGKPKECVDCGEYDPTIRYQWANISGKYKRDIKDYKRLCPKCHAAFDEALRPKGEKQGISKLTVVKVKEIWRLWGTGLYTHKELGVRFKVARSTITSILTNRNWKHI